MLILTTLVAKSGQRTLEDLDNYRYNDALDIFNSNRRVRPMALEDIKTLAEWKL
jgi:hypothetical protein